MNNNGLGSQSDDKENLKAPEGSVWDSSEAFDELEKMEEMEKEGREGTGEFIEDLDNIDGVEQQKVAEKKEKQSEDKPVTNQTTSAQTQLTTEQLKAKLLETAPLPKVMKKQIEEKIYQEMKIINKKIKKVRGRAEMAYELNNLVGKLRELKEILEKLFNATYDTLKYLWLKFVHGLA